MRTVGIIALSLLGVACVSHVPAATCPLALRMRRALERDAPLDVAEGSPLAAARGRHFIFIGGFLNEAIPGYFSDNLEVVSAELGSPTSTLFPSSLADLDRDAEAIRDAVNERYAAAAKPVVLVGHSKGAAAAVLAVLRYPELVQSGKLDRVIAIQGAFGGSHVADAIQRSVLVSPAIVRFRGLEMLTGERAKKCFADALASVRERLSADELAALSSRVYYVRSWQTSSAVSTGLVPTHHHLSRYGSGQTDGLLLVEHMKLDGFGVDLGVLRGDHAALTVRGLLSNSTARERKAFTRAVLGEAFATH